MTTAAELRLIIEGNPRRGIVPRSKRARERKAMSMAFDDVDSAAADGDAKVAAAFKATKRAYETYLKDVTGEQWRVKAGDDLLSMTAPGGKAIDIYWDWDPMFDKAEITIEGPGRKVTKLVKIPLSKLTAGGGKAAAAELLMKNLGENVEWYIDDVLMEAKSSLVGPGGLPGYAVEVIAGMERYGPVRTKGKRDGKGVVFTHDGVSGTVTVTERGDGDLKVEVYTRGRRPVSLMFTSSEPVGSVARSKLPREIMNALDRKKAWKVESMALADELRGVLSEERSPEDRAAMATDPKFRAYLKVLTGKASPSYTDVMKALMDQGLSRKAASEYAMFATDRFSEDVETETGDADLAEGKGKKRLAYGRSTVPASEIGYAMGPKWATSQKSRKGAKKAFNRSVRKTKRAEIAARLRGEDLDEAIQVLIDEGFEDLDWITERGGVDVEKLLELVVAEAQNMSALGRQIEAFGNNAIATSKMDIRNLQSMARMIDRTSKKVKGVIARFISGVAMAEGAEGCGDDCDCDECKAAKAREKLGESLAGELRGILGG